MCLNHIIAHEAYHFCLVLPLTLAPHVSSNNVGYLELKNSSADCFFGGSTNLNGWKLGACNIMLERS